MALPLLVSVAALLGVAGASLGSPLISSSAIRDYAGHVAELGQLKDYSTVLLFPMLWLILGAALLASLAHSWTSLRNRVGGAARGGLDQRVFQKYGPVYLGLWSPSDEAINGLGNTLRLDGDVTPKWQGAEKATLSRLAAIFNWPARALYNAVFARATDELNWERVLRRLQGDDTAGLEMGRVTHTPSEPSEKWSKARTGTRRPRWPRCETRWV
jgi:hypothetical protein